MQLLPNQPIANTNPANSMLPSNIEPKMQNKIALLTALCKAQSEVDGLRQQVCELQAENILNEIYCNKLQFQLTFKEKKGGRGKNGKLLDDGLPHMLSSNEFYERVVQFTQWQQ
ncbi:hypothetical protein P691DRAFT_690141, partial [Macrolepiota fuliginosa MF-IS2]